MIRYKKIRGHNRILKSIDDWVEYNKTLDLEYLKQRQRDYVKVWVSPYRNISIVDSVFAPPRGKTRQKIVDGIFTIYNSWKEKLEKLNEPYYLKIWYFPHDVSKCQVVCAIRDFIDFYDVTFFKPKEDKTFPEDPKGLKWEYRHQEHHVTDRDIGFEEEFYSKKDFLNNKRWVERIMKDSRTRINTYDNDDGTQTTYYSIKECDVWIGS